MSKLQRFSKNPLSAILLVLLVFTQLSFINSIFAYNEPSDVQSNLHMDGAESNILSTDYYAFEPGSVLPLSARTKICNLGTESVESFVLENNSENLNTTNVDISDSNTTATSDGIFDFDLLGVVVRWTKINVFG